MLGDVGWQELVLVLAILALVFGAGRVADIGGALGKGIREFRNEVKGEDTKANAEEPKAAQSAGPKDGPTE